MSDDPIKFWEQRVREIVKEEILALVNMGGILVTLQTQAPLMGTSKKIVPIKKSLGEPRTAMQETPRPLPLATDRPQPQPVDTPTPSPILPVGDEHEHHYQNTLLGRYIAGSVMDRGNFKGVREVTEAVAKDASVVASLGDAQVLDAVRELLFAWMDRPKVLAPPMFKWGHRNRDGVLGVMYGSKKQRRPVRRNGVTWEDRVLVVLDRYSTQIAPMTGKEVQAHVGSVYPEWEEKLPSMGSVSSGLSKLHTSSKHPERDRFHQGGSKRRMLYWTTPKK